MKLYLGIPLALLNEKCKYFIFPMNTGHNTICNTILSFLARQVRIAAFKEKSSQSSDRTRPADVLIHTFGHLRSPQEVNVTIVSPLTITTIENVNSGAGIKKGMKGAVTIAE
jgi:hypothetical protein